MKNEMRQEQDQATLVEEFKGKHMEKMTERRKRATQLVEEWSKVPEIGKGLIDSYDRNPRMIENTAIVLENMGNEFAKMTETQISSAFNGLTPENALRVVRLGYPNSNRGQAFYEFAMETAEDGIWYLSPTYASSKRDATAGETMHETDDYRYSSLEEIETPTGAIDGANKAYVGASAGNLANPPLKPFHVRLYEDNVIIAQDDGAGAMVGAKLNTAATNTINYTTGAITVTYTVAPISGTVIQFSYVYDYEDSAQYADLGEVELKLRKVNFKIRSYRLGISWSKQSELVLGTTLNIDAEEALLKGASEELKKSLDFEAFRLGYRVALNKSSYRTFDADYLSAGADSPQVHAQTLNRVFEDTADDIRATLNRGGFTSIVAGSQAANYISTYLSAFSDAGADAKEIGIYKIGTYKGNKPIFKVPRTTVMPTDEIYLVWNNEEAGDMALGFAVLLPMYQSPVIEYKNMNKEAGLAEWGDHRILTSDYIRRIKIDNVNKY